MMPSHSYLAEFPQEAGLIYLNHAAVAPWPQRTAAAVRQFAEENVTCGARHYPRWVAMENRLRESLRKLINAPSADDIALMKNTSEALSFVAYGLTWQAGDNVVTGNEEFPSNRIVWESLATQGVALRQADLTAAPTPEDALFAQVDERTRLITISSVQYATGRRMDLERIGAFCRDHGILFCVDAIQSIGAIDFDVQTIGADFVMADGHKWMLGPEGLALFYSRPQARDRLRLFEYGWHMVREMGNYDRKEWEPAGAARRFECGSPNMLGICALEASLSLHHEIGMNAIEIKVIENCAYLIDMISDEKSLEVVSASEPGRYAGIVTFRHRTRDPLELHRHLSGHGVICAPRGGGIRFSPHFYTTREQLARAVQLAAG